MMAGAALSRRRALGLLALAAAPLPARAGTAPIRLGSIGLSFYAVAGALVTAVLRRAGHDVTVSSGTHPEMFDRLAAGEIDLLVAAWLPHAHGPLHAPVADRVVEVATLYDGARLFLAVPDRAPADIRSVADLARPNIAAAAQRAIVGVAPGSGSARGAEAMMQAYGLAAAGWTLTIGSAADWTAAIETGLAGGGVFAAPLWTPLWTETVFAMRPLEDPLGIYGGADRAIILARRDAWELWPEQTRATVARIAPGRAAIAAMDAAAVRGGLTPEAAAAAWMADEAARVEDWLRAP